MLTLSGLIADLGALVLRFIKARVRERSGPNGNKIRLRYSVQYCSTLSGCDRYPGIQRSVPALEWINGLARIQTLTNQRIVLQGARPERVLLLMRTIKAELEGFQGRTLSFEELASYTGEAASTLFDKLHRPHQPQVESVIRLLERLPEENRSRLLESVCRCYPTLCHPRIAHDPVQVSNMKSLLRQRTGFTVLQGRAAGDRAFVFTALGHENDRFGPERRTVGGIDIGRPDWFVEVTGLTYTGDILAKDQLAEAIRQAWTELSAVDDCLVLLNGVWSQVPDLRQQIIQRATNCHVVVADESRLGREEFGARLPCPLNVVHIVTEPDTRIRLKIYPA
jgi:hypothetical protein